MTQQRTFEDLSKQEARELLRTYVEGLPARAQAFVDEVRRLAGPAERLDYTRDSLVPAWEWVMATRRFPPQPVDDATMRASDPPWWYDFDPELGMTFGPDVARLVTNLAAYVGLTATSQLPNSEWKLGTGRQSGFFQVPLLVTERGTPWPIETTLSTFIFRTRHGGAETARDTLQINYDTWTGRWADWSPPSPPTLEYGLDVLDEPSGGLTHEISLNDVVAHEQAPRVKRFVKRLTAVPGVTEVLHPDRDTILLGVVGPDDEAFRAAVASAWLAAKS